MDLKEKLIDLTLESPLDFADMTKFCKTIKLTDNDFEIETKNESDEVPLKSQSPLKDQSPINPFNDLLTIYLPNIAGVVAERLRINTNFNADFLLACFLYENYIKKSFVKDQKLMLFHAGIATRTICNTLVLLHKSLSDFGFFGCDKQKGDPSIFLNGPKGSINVFEFETTKVIEKQIIEKIGTRPFGVYLFDIKHTSFLETISSLRLMFVCLNRKGTAIIRMPNLTTISSIQKRQYNYLFQLLNCLFDNVELLICPWAEKFYLICSKFVKFNDQHTKHFDTLFSKTLEDADFYPKISTETPLYDWFPDIEKATKLPFTLTKTLELQILELFDV